MVIYQCRMKYVSLISLYNKKVGRLIVQLRVPWPVFKGCRTFFSSLSCMLCQTQSQSVVGSFLFTFAFLPACLSICLLAVMRADCHPFGKLSHSVSHKLCHSFSRSVMQ